MPSFGENLKKLRKSRGYSQDRFARIIGSNQVNVSAWELNTRTPSIQTIRHIAETFHVPLSSLISMGETCDDDDFVREVADALHRDPKVRLLFDKTRYMDSEDLEAVLSVVNIITRERGKNE